jgi:tRNA-specific 2-thiouridylase
VSPGQACVFYDALDGQARVLGGGFIQSAVAASEAAPAHEARTTRSVAG